MRNTLICTVGTSLISNLGKDNLKANFSDEYVKQLDNAFHQRNEAILAKKLNELQPNERLLGAEINTIEEAKSKNWLKFEKLFFLVSDTKDGEFTGKLLQKYFELRKDLDFNFIEYIKIDELQDEKPKKFKTTGLRELVRKIGDIIGRVGGTEYVAIDATGGYKAQIAIAVLLGQALDIPVYYKHERFSEIIDFPPLPVSLDFDFLGEYADTLNLFEKGEILSQNDINEIPEKLEIFLTDITDNGTKYYELNAIGQVYLTAFRLRYPYAPNLKELKDQDRKQPTFGNDHHFPNGFKELVNQVWSENKWIKTCISIEYDKQKEIKNTGFNVKQLDNNEFALIGKYVNKGNPPKARFKIFLSDNSKANLNWAAQYLNNKYVN